MINRFVIFIGDTGGCYYYRCYVPYNKLTEYGFDVLATNYIEELNLNPQNDVLVLQRQHHPAIVEFVKNFKASGGKVVSESDDLLSYMPQNNPARNAYTKEGGEIARFEELLSISDLVTVSTPRLAELYNKFNKNVHVCYNSLEEKWIKPLQREYRKNNKIQITWSGSGTHHDDFLTIVKPVTEIMRAYPNTNFNFVGQNYQHLFPSDIQRRMKHVGQSFTAPNTDRTKFIQQDGSHTVSRYYDLLEKADADIAIAPLLSHTFNACKSYLKLMEYSKSKTPFLASNFGPYSQYARNKANIHDKANAIGLLADNQAEWRKYLKMMIEDPKMCQKMAENNFNHLQSNHLISHNIHQWLNALETIGAIKSDRQGQYTERFVPT